MSTKAVFTVFLERKRFIMRGIVQGVGFRPFKVCLLSVPEGDDKPVKYPEVFSLRDGILLNKIDLIDGVGFDRDFFYKSLRTLNTPAPVFELSCRTGEGLQAWGSWLKVAREHILN